MDGEIIWAELAAAGVRDYIQADPICNWVNNNNTMSKVKALLAGMAIILKYEESPWLTAEYDKLYVGQQDGPAVDDISVEDEKELRNIGWRKSNAMRCWVFRVV